MSKSKKIKEALEEIGFEVWSNSPYLNYAMNGAKVMTKEAHGVHLHLFLYEDYSRISKLKIVSKEHNWLVTEVSFFEWQPTIKLIQGVCGLYEGIEPQEAEQPRTVLTPDIVDRYATERHKREYYAIKDRALDEAIVISFHPQFLDGVSVMLSLDYHSPTNYGNRTQLSITTLEELQAFYKLWTGQEMPEI